VSQALHLYVIVVAQVAAEAEANSAASAKITKSFFISFCELLFVFYLFIIIDVPSKSPNI